MDAVDHAGPDGIYFKDLAEAVKTRLSQSQLKTLGSLGWHVTVVKLELEAAGDLIRAQGKGPHRLLRAAR